MDMIEKLKKFKDDTNANTIMMLVFMAVGILILIVVVTLVPSVSYNVQNSITVPTGEWTQTGFTNGSEMWAQLSPMISTTALVAVVGVLIGVLLLALALNRRG